MQRICERWVSVAVALMMKLYKKWMPCSGSGIHDEARSVASDVPDGDNSSPSVPEGTGGPKSK